VETSRALTELRYVGDRLAKRIEGWIENPPEVPEPPRQRRGFNTMSRVLKTLAEHPDWEPALRADLQMHTVYSDGLSTVEEMAGAAEARGREYIAITDHSTGQRIPTGMDEEAIGNQWKEIEAANESLRDRGSKLRVLRSIEMNLYPDGTGALAPGSGGDFELVIGSFHSKLQEEDDQTKRYVAALQNPDVDVIGHPQTRMYNRRGGLQAEWDAVFEAAARTGTALEINASPARQDLSLELLETARDHDVTLTIGTDAHSIPELDWVVFSLAAAITAGIKRERILNFRPCEDVLAWRAERRA
jgi:DNA polymerase (family 10)